MEELAVQLPVQLPLSSLSSKRHELSGVGISCLLSEFSSRSVLFSIRFTTARISYHGFGGFLGFFCFLSQEEKAKKPKKSKNTIEAKQGGGNQGTGSEKWHIAQSLYHNCGNISTEVELFDDNTDCMIILKDFKYSCHIPEEVQTHNIFKT